jgi:hypothetical protein
MVINAAVVSETAIFTVKTLDMSLRGELGDIKRFICGNSCIIASQP